MRFLVALKVISWWMDSAEWETASSRAARDSVGPKKSAPTAIVAPTRTSLRASGLGSGVTDIRLLIVAAPAICGLAAFGSQCITALRENMFKIIFYWVRERSSSVYKVEGFP